MSIQLWRNGFVDVESLQQEIIESPRRVRDEAIDTGLEAASDPTEFAVVGIGKPLSIRIHTAYVGDITSWWNRKADVLVVSGVKAPQTFDAVGRTINALQPRVEDNQYVEFSAFDQGSSLVYYSKAVTDFDLTVSFELIPDSFDDRTLSKIANLFQLAGGLPVFAPASSYLMAGSFVTRILGNLGKSLLESAPTLRDTLRLNFGVAGLPLFAAGFYLVTNNGTLKDVNQYEIGEYQSGNQTVIRLLNRETRQPYVGNTPYMIIGIDGHLEPNLERYEPQLATAAVLQRFYPTGDGASVAVDELGKAVTLYNDLKYRTQAQSIAKQLDEWSASDRDNPEFIKLQNLYEALRANIRQEEFQIGEKAN